MHDLKTAISKHKGLLATYRQEFKRLFKGFELAAFMCTLTGFDVIKFDEYLKVPDGISTKQYVEKYYGPEAVALILKLIGTNQEGV